MTQGLLGWVGVAVGTEADDVAEQDPDVRVALRLDVVILLQFGGDAGREDDVEENVGAAFCLMCVQRHLNADAQLALVERFGDVAIGCSGLGSVEGRLVRVGGEEDDRDLAALADDAGGFHAVHHAGELDVHEHQIRAKGHRRLHGFLGGKDRGYDRVSGCMQLAFKVHCDDAFVLNDKNAGFCHGLTFPLGSCGGKEMVTRVPPSRSSSKVP